MSSNRGKHLVDSPKDLVLGCLRGLARSNPSLYLDPAHRVIYLKPSKQRVHIVSGGGSGHEPAQAGFIGRNMIDCAVSGDIFVRHASMVIQYTDCRLLRVLQLSRLASTVSKTILS